MVHMLISVLHQSFQHLENGKTIDRRDGNGLGLAISKCLVEAMNGEIGCTSELDKGSTFWFTATLPRVETVRMNVGVAHPSLPGGEDKKRLTLIHVALDIATEQADLEALRGIKVLLVEVLPPY